MADLDRNEPRQRPAFTKHQKAGFALLIAIGFFGVIMGFRSFPANLRRPFELQLASYTGPEYQTLSEKESAEVERQKITDTDGDGLMDYDELYVYKTSPYLADSDSDGFDDKTELYSGNDPNCPQGKECGRTILQAEDAAGADDNSQFLSGFFKVDPGTLEGVPLDSMADLQQFFASLGVEEIRALLKSQGVPEETIAELDDDELMALFQAAIDQATASGEFSAMAETENSNVDESSQVEQTP